MKRPRALFFDLDGTLLDGSGFGEAVARTCRRIAAARPGLSAERLLAANSEVWASYWPEVEREWTLGALDGGTVSLEAWRRALRACGSDDEELARLALETLLDHAREAHRLFDDVQEVIGRLVGRPLALITNGAADSQREKLRALDIERHFDAIVVSGEVGVAKPDAAIFQIALEQLGVAPEAAWHVGDSLEADVAGAHNAGLGAAVWLNRRGAMRPPEHPEPHVEIRSLTELLDHLDL